MVAQIEACSFHLEQSLTSNPKKYIVIISLEDHIKLCRKWHMAPTMEATLVESKLAQKWWPIRHCWDLNKPAMDSWLRF